MTRMSDDELDLYYGGRAQYLARCATELADAEQRLLTDDFAITDQWAIDFGMTPETERAALESKITSLRSAIKSNK